MKVFLQSKFIAMLFGIGIINFNQPAFARSHLDKIEISESPVCFTLLFDFKKSTAVKPHYNKETKTFSLFFPQIRAEEIQSHKNWHQFSNLTQYGFNVELENQGENSIGSCLRIDCSNAKTATSTNEKSSFIVKWTNNKGIQWHDSNKEGCNRFTASFFFKAGLDQLNHTPAIQLATNDVIQNDFSSMPGISTNHKSRQSRRVIIDAGHGGKDKGARGCGNILEKKVALTLAKKLATKLKAAGYQVHLTRNDDYSVPLVKRCNLAHQLKADAFISIHLNSAGKFDAKTHGIESYYLAEEGTVPPSHVGGYYFINTEHDEKLIKLVNKFEEQKIQGSKNLAHCVQSALISSTRKNTFKPKNRGVKPEHLRLLLHNNIPTTLVEVGFVTNPQEAAMLQTESYQEVLATGMLHGINKYFSAQ